MALATYLRGLLRKSSSSKPIRPRRLNRVNLALESLESRVTPTTWTSITNSITNDNTVGFGGSPLVTIAGTDLPTDITRIEFWLNNSSAFQAATINRTTTAVTFQFPPASSSATPTYDVRVYTTSDIDTGLSISVNSPANITISQASGSTTGGTPVNILGNYLYGASNVKFGTTDAGNFNPSNNTDTEIKVSSPSSSTEQKVDISISFPNFDFDTKVNFTYVNPTFNMTNFAPNFSSQAATPITINGGNLENVSKIQFWNSQAAPSKTYDATNLNPSGDGTTLSFSLPAGIDQNANYFINLIDKNGANIVSSNQFYYASAPALPVTNIIGADLGQTLSKAITADGMLQVNSFGDFPATGDLFIQTSLGTAVVNYTGVSVDAGGNCYFAGVTQYTSTTLPTIYTDLGYIDYTGEGYLYENFAATFQATTGYFPLQINQNSGSSKPIYATTWATTYVPSGVAPTNLTLQSNTDGSYGWSMTTKSNSGQNVPEFLLLSGNNSFNLPLTPTNSATMAFTVGNSGLTYNPTGGVPRPSSYTPGTQAKNPQIFDFFEINLNAAASDPNVQLGTRNLFEITLDSSAVDQFGMPITFGNSTSFPEESNYGIQPIVINGTSFNIPVMGVNNGTNSQPFTRDQIMAGFNTFTTNPSYSAYNPLLQSDGNGGYLRITNPSDYLSSSKDASSSNLNYVFDEAVYNLFTSPPNNQVSISNGNYTYTGVPATLNNNGFDYKVLAFTSTNDTNIGTVYVFMPLFKDNMGTAPNPSLYQSVNAPSWLQTNGVVPTSGNMVFGNSGAFADSATQTGTNYSAYQIPILAQIEDQLVTALNRGCANTLLPTTYSSTGTSQSAFQVNYATPKVTVSPGMSFAKDQIVTLTPNPPNDGDEMVAIVTKYDSTTGKLDLTLKSYAGKATSSYSSWSVAATNTALWGNPANHYPTPNDLQTNYSNAYGAYLHTYQIESGIPIFYGATFDSTPYGLIYALAYDDNGSLSTTMTILNATQNTFVTLDPWTASNLVSTTTTLASNNNPSHLNDPVTFTATVSPASGTVAPTGTVSFYNGATPLGTGTLTASGRNAVASFTTSSLKGHTNSITATYSGSNAFDSSTSPVLTQTVDGTPPSPVATSVVVASNINPSNQGQAVTFTATVTAAKGIPSGTVNFLDGTTVIGTGNLNAQGVATFQTSTLAVGTHSITAAFPASVTYAASTSSVLKQVVAQDGPASTSTTLVPNPNPTYAGHTVTFTATVAALRGTQVPTGTVTFLVDGTPVGHAQLSNGVATIQHAFATGGNYSLIAKYQGDISFAESQSAPISEVVNQPSSSTVNVTLSSSVNPSTLGQLVLFTAKLQPVTGSGSPTGIVDFYVNNVWQNSTTVFTDGSYGQVATWLTNALPLGDNSITAKYRGDSSFDPATSKPFSQVVTLNPNQIMQPADLGPGSYVAGVGNLLAVKPSFGEMQFFQPFPNYNGQVTVNTMDRNSDGKADTILAAVAGGAAPHVLVIDANTGYLLSSFYAFSQAFLGGVTIAGGPVHLAPTGSATPVVVCGARAGAQPTVAVFDALGNGYGAFFAFDPAYKGGVNVAMSEANAQGNALVVVSSTINTHVKVFDIANVQPSELASYYTFGSANYSPGVWASAGDIDGNATQELLVGTAGGTAAARIKVYNLLTGAAIPGKEVKPFGDNYLGSVRVGLSDYNRDGVLDLLAASGPMAMGTVRAFDFDTLQELESLFVSNVTDGVFIATNFSRGGTPVPA